jgi:uncharacterized protein YbcI
VAVPASRFNGLLCAPPTSDRALETQPIERGVVLEDPKREIGPSDPDPHPEEAIAPTPEAVADAVCRDILAIQRDSYGRGAEHAKAHVLDDTVIVILDGLELLPNEEFMIGRGQATAVRELREHFQQAIQSTFRAAVERATGRRVIGFASHVQLDEPRFAVEVFRLEPLS